MGCIYVHTSVLDCIPSLESNPIELILKLFVTVHKG